MISSAAIVLKTFVLSPAKSLTAHFAAMHNSSPSHRQTQDTTRDLFACTASAHINVMNSAQALQSDCNFDWQIDCNTPFWKDQLSECAARRNCKLRKCSAGGWGGQAGWQKRNALLATPEELCDELPLHNSEAGLHSLPAELLIQVLAHYKHYLYHLSRLWHSFLPLREPDPCRTPFIWSPRGPSVDAPDDITLHGIV